MKTLEDIYEKYSRIASNLQEVANSEYSMSVRKGGIEITVPNVTSKLYLRPSDLQKLDSYQTVPNVQKLTYHWDCGFSFEAYSEFFVTLDYAQYSYFDLPYDDFSSSINLRFKISDVLIVLGLASPLISLLFEPPYFDNDYHGESFANYPAIRLLGADSNTAVDYYHKAIYYLNSYYLRSTGFTAGLHHVAPDYGFDYTQFAPAETFEKIIRQRVRIRQDFKNTPPLILYNHACNSTGDEAFISYYRVLEYYFRRGVLKTIEELRYDASASPEDIIDVAQSKDELSMLTSLLSKILTRSRRKKILEYATSKTLIERPEMKLLAKGIYSYRCSIVHAKEERLNTSKLPNPFFPATSERAWIYIVRESAELAIRDLNTV